MFLYFWVLISPKLIFLFKSRSSSRRILFRDKCSTDQRMESRFYLEVFNVLFSPLAYACKSKCCTDKHFTIKHCWQTCNSQKTHPNWILASNKVFRNVLNCIVQCVLQRVITFSWWTKGSTIRLIKRELTLSLRWFVGHSTFERYFNYSNDKKERYLDISYFIFLEDFCLPIKVDGLEKIQIITCIK